MAKTNKADKYRKQFEHEVNRLKRIVKEEKKKGFEFKISPIPETPKNVTRKDVLAIRKVTPATIRKLGQEGKVFDSKQQPKKQDKNYKSNRSVKSGVPGNTIDVTSAKQAMEDVKRGLDKSRKLIAQLNKLKDDILKDKSISNLDKERYIKQIDGILTGINQNISQLESAQKTIEQKATEVYSSAEYKGLMEKYPNVFFGDGGLDLDEYKKWLGDKTVPKNDAQLAYELEEAANYVDELVFDLTNQLDDLADQVDKLRADYDKVVKDQKAFLKAEKELNDALNEKKKEYDELEKKQYAADKDIVDEFVSRFKEYLFNNQNMDNSMIPVLEQIIAEAIRKQNLHELAERITNMGNTIDWFKILYSYEQEEGDVSYMNTAKQLCDVLFGVGSAENHRFTDYIRSIAEKEKEKRQKQLFAYNKAHPQLIIK